MQRSPWRDLRGGCEGAVLGSVSLTPWPFAGPTVLEVFNTLLKHLRLSVESEANDLQGGPAGSATVTTASKDNDEKIVQNAIIQTIGGCTSLFKAVTHTSR